MKTILAVVPHFPSPVNSADGQANYLTSLVPVLGLHDEIEVHIIALQVGDQPAVQSGEGWSVTRVSPPKKLPDVFALYLPEHLQSSLNALDLAARRAAKSLGVDTPVWCHGYETGNTVKTLTENGHHVVAVVHYSVGIETMHDLALGDDPTRRKAFHSPWATAIGQIWPKRHREVGVRWASRMGKYSQHAPLPEAIQTQFRKLALERNLIANASKIIAVGPSFEREINHLYPCTASRSTAVIAGAPNQIPSPKWPQPIEPNPIRIVMVGRPTGQKGWDYACEAFKAISDQHAKSIQLVLIGGLGQGNGPYSAYSERVAGRFKQLKGISVHNLGALSHTETLAHLAAADLLLFPSVFEPLGLVILEAMAAGCNILASDAAGPSDLLSEPWGHIMPFKNPASRVQAIVDGLDSFLQLSRDQIDSNGEAAQKSASIFTWNECASVHFEALLRR